MSEAADQQHGEDGRVAVTISTSYETLPESPSEAEHLLPPSYPAPSRYQHSAKSPVRRPLWLRPLFIFSLLSLTFGTIALWTVRRSRSYEFSDRLSVYGTSLRGSEAEEEWPLPPRRVGLKPFYPSQFSPLLPTRPLERTMTTKAFTDACAVEWIAHGRLCQEMHGRVATPQIDVLWTWTNGSKAETMTTWREAVSAEIAQAGETFKRAVRLGRRVPGAAVVKHFRDHDELRHSIRSVLSSFSPGSIRALHLVVGDTPACHPADPVATDFDFPREAQLPHWLDTKKTHFSASRPTNFNETIPFHIHPHSEIFKTPAYYDPLVLAASDNTTINEDAVFDSDLSGARAWRIGVIPSFNSLAIESQLANVEGLSDAVLSMNDDFFVLRNLSTTDIASPLGGPMFRLQRDLMVRGIAPDHTRDDPDGEWRGLSFSNWLLDRRFGERARPYLIHEGKSVSTPLMRELQTVFMDELTMTAQSRFRGKGPREAQTAFLYIHYVIEKHRESLLASFFAARSDTNQDGQFSPAERSTLLKELNAFDGEEDIKVLPPRRSTLQDLPDAYSEAGLPHPAETSFHFSSADGYAGFFLPLTDAKTWPSWDQESIDRSKPTCLIKINECFGDDFVLQGGDVSVQDTLRRVAFERPKCGDCIIVALLGRSGSKGLDAFLPPAPKRTPLSSPSDNSVEALGLATSFATIDLSFSPSETSSLRQRAARLIQRYSYTVGDSSAELIPIRSGGGLRTVLKKMKDLPAFLALNDDLGSSLKEAAINSVNDVLHDWYEHVLPNRTVWELQ